MEENLRRVFEELKSASGPANLVEEFQDLLRAEGVEVEGTTGAKYFAAMKEGRTIIVLAHESTDQGFWGIRRKVVERCQGVAHEKKGELQGWGAALLDGSPQRGFWVEGDTIRQLYEAGVIQYSSSNDQYLFVAKELRKVPDRALYFIGIGEFLERSGLVEPERRLEIEGEDDEA